MMASRTFRARLLPVLLLLGLARGAAGHGGIHEQIESLTREIGQSSSDAQLYLRRGELHRIHRDWTAALADYAAAARLGPELAQVEFCRGRMLLEAGRPAEAKIALDRFLSGDPRNPEALVARARTLTKLARHEASAEDYTRALEHHAQPKPDLFVERAQAEAAAGRVDAGLRGLDEGIRRFGPLVTLELPAIELELRAHRYDRALARLALVSSQSPRKETWQARQGEILELANRATEALQAYSAALKAIETLPPERRRTAAMMELTERVQSAMARLKTDAGRP